MVLGSERDGATRRRDDEERSNTYADPLRVNTDVKFKTIAAGGGHTCAISVDGVGYCWGGNWHGQLGVGDREGDAAAPCCYRLPRPIRTDVRLRAAVAAGISSCAVAIGGEAYCWGSPQEGRLGTGAADAANKSADKTIPTPVAGNSSFETVLPRAWHTCGLSLAHEVFCWGGDLQMKSAVPERVTGLTDVSTVTTGHFHDCAVTRDGTAFCWGTNTDGQLGDGSTREAAAPQRVATTHRLLSIAAGGNVEVSTPGHVATWGFTCAVTADDGSVLCWGDNRHGALAHPLVLLRQGFMTGTGVSDRPVEPLPDARVIGFAAAIAIATGTSLSLAPVWLAARVDAAQLLQQGTRTSTATGRLGRMLVGIQVALSLVLVTNAGLLARTSNRFARPIPGFALTAYSSRASHRCPAVTTVPTTTHTFPPSSNASLLCRASRKQP
jgi:Regulator of chromosome condensation (RCC1) repeat